MQNQNNIYFNDLESNNKNQEYQKAKYYQNCNSQNSNNNQYTNNLPEGEDSYNQNYEDEPVPFEKELRKSFIQKVFGILSAQLVLTFLICVISLSSKDIRHFQMKNTALLYLCMGITLIISITLFCFLNIARKVPINYFLCFLFTICKTYLVSYMCIFISPKIVLMALTMTCALVIGLTLYAFITKTDFTGYGHYMFIASLLMLVCGLFISFTNNKIIHVIYSGLGVLMFSIYLIYDVQLISGNYENKLDYDDYIIGSMILYIDIIMLFEHILNIMNSLNE
jgi:FtsH-binding integral membrane protein